MSEQRRRVDVDQSVTAIARTYLHVTRVLSASIFFFFRCLASREAIFFFSAALIRMPSPSKSLALLGDDWKISLLLELALLLPLLLGSLCA